MKKIKVFIILIIMLVGGIFIIKSAKNDSVALSQNTIINEIEVEGNNAEKLENVNTVENIKNNEVQSNIENNKKQVVERNYFDDALFIGDSRTVGISEYGDLNNATFFANTGMSVYNVFEKSVSVPKVGKLKLEQLLKSKKFGKIYIMLGINELGYDMNKTAENYEKLIDYVKDNQSNAIIYVQANLHVTHDKSSKDKTINNANIDKFNSKIAKFADNKKIFYIDINEKFDDKNGNLTAEYTKDNVHIYAKYYKEWSKWLSQNAVI